MTTLPCFTSSELALAHRLLAGRIATMMGRKMEEEDWRQAYFGAKGIPDAGWSNLQIDVMHQNLGVEHKMLCVSSRQSVLAVCGTSLMHPAGTRSIRIPAEEDATTAAQDVLRQYGDLIRFRTRLVEVRWGVETSSMTRDAATTELIERFGIPKSAALRLVPVPGHTPQSPATLESTDMRTGWLLWQDSLKEFLYFEEPMLPPDPSRFRAVWKESGGGSRKRSRNLWVFDNESGRKTYSITTDAGAKIQPYFDVPAVGDANLYHLVVQGEQVNGLVRLWVTPQTAELLRMKVGSLETSELSQAILTTAALRPDGHPQSATQAAAVEIFITAAAYAALVDSFEGVSDEHLMQLCAQAFDATVN